jgi:hypothetical protein
MAIDDTAVTGTVRIGRVWPLLILYDRESEIYVALRSFWYNKKQGRDLSPLAKDLSPKGKNQSIWKL